MDNYIELAYKQAIKQAERLEKVADNLDKAKGYLAGGTQELAGGWSGNASAKYQRNCVQVQEDIASNIRYIRNVAKAIRKTASVYRKVETEAYEAATKKE